MITPVRIPETPVILHRPQPPLEEEDRVSVDTAKTPSEKQKKSPSPSGLSSSKTNPSAREAVMSVSLGSEVEQEMEGQEMEELEEEMVVVSSMKDVPVATLVSTA